MEPLALTYSASTLSYTFAAGWAPPDDDKGYGLHVPGAFVNGFTIAGNLLNLALWRLIDLGLIEARAHRASATVTASTAVEGSFSHLERIASPAERGVTLTGLEARLWLGIAEAREPVGTLAEAYRRFRGEDPAGTRLAVLGMGLSNRLPNHAVMSICFTDALQAGLVTRRGRFRPRPLVVESQRLVAARDEHARLRERRAAYRATNTALDDAVIGDCFAALIALEP